MFNKTMLWTIILGISMLSACSCKPDNNSDSPTANENNTETRDQASTRIPAEWEKQKEIWMQWPLDYEPELRSVFAKIISVITTYEDLHLFVESQRMQNSVRQMLDEAGADISRVTFHLAQYDNCWLRDNGPVYVTDKSFLWLQDWGFNGWNKNFGKDTLYLQDDKIPSRINKVLGLKYEDKNSYILERGNMEANGSDTIILNWDCQKDRNPGWTKADTDSMFKKAFGVKNIIWVEGHDPLDGTTGHIDGIARFINETTIGVIEVADKSAESYPGEIANIEKFVNEAESLGFTIERFRIPGFVSYRGQELAASYMNYLVGNGFVAAMAFGNTAWDNEAKARLERLYPGRTVHMINVNELWIKGGGIHCVTNDVPEH